MAAEVGPARRAVGWQLAGAAPRSFDRMLMAQAQIEQALVVTLDPVFGEYGLAVVW